MAQVPQTGTRTFSVNTSPPSQPIPPDVRPTRASVPEKEERILLTIQMVLDGRRKHEIKKFFRSRWGVGSRQVETYLLLARARLAETNKLDLNQLRAEFFARYMEMARTTKSESIKLNALKSAGSVYGVDAPQKVAQTTTDGIDIDVHRQAVEQLTVEELRVLRAARDRLHRITSGESGGAN